MSRVAAAAAVAAAACYLSYRARRREEESSSGFTSGFLGTVMRKPWRGESAGNNNNIRLRRGCSYFLSGVMQGRKAEGEGVEGTVSQDYRQHMKDAILAADAGAAVVEPWDLVGAECERLYPKGTPQAEMFKENADVRHCFGVCVEAAVKADVVVSYLPEASMGSAVEIYAAKGAGRTILCVAPGRMAQNWVVRSYADHVFEDIPALRRWLIAAAASSADQ